MIIRVAKISRSCQVPVLGFWNTICSLCCKTMSSGAVPWCICPRHPWQRDIRGVRNVTQNDWDNAAVVWADTAVGNPINGGDWSAQGCEGERNCGGVRYGTAWILTWAVDARGAAHWINGGGPIGCGVLVHPTNLDATVITGGVFTDEGDSGHTTDEDVLTPGCTWGTGSRCGWERGIPTGWDDNSDVLPKDLALRGWSIPLCSVGFQLNGGRPTGCGAFVCAVGPEALEGTISKGDEFDTGHMTEGDVFTHWWELGSGSGIETVVLEDIVLVEGVESVVKFFFDAVMSDRFVISLSLAFWISCWIPAVVFLLATLRFDEGFRPPRGSPCLVLCPDYFSPPRAKNSLGLVHAEQATHS